MPKGRQEQARKAQMRPCSHQVRSAGPAHLKMKNEGREFLVATYFSKQHVVYMVYFSGVLIENAVGALGARGRRGRPRWGPAQVATKLGASAWVV